MDHRTIVSFFTCQLVWVNRYALGVVTANPARALGLAGKGAIAVGQDADLLLIDPNTLAIQRVMSGGQWRA